MVAHARSLLGAVVISLGIGMSGISTADPLQISLYDPNAEISGYPSPYALVTFDLVDSNTATFTFAAVSPYVMFGSGVALNFSGAVTLNGSITGNSSCADPYSVGAPGNISEFGTFNFIVDTFNGPNCGSTSISFTVDLNSGSWANTSAILAANDKGFLAAAHIAAGCIVNPTNGKLECEDTGFAGGNETRVPPSEIPEPHTLALLALGLLGLGFARRKQG